MGTEIQAKAYFSGSSSIWDLNESLGSSIWSLYREHKTLKSDQFYNPFLTTRPAVDRYLEFDKEEIRQTILKHESIFRHQLEELHRLYRRQRDLIDEIRRRELHQHLIPAEMSQSSLFFSHTPSGDIKKICHVSDSPTMGPNFGNPTTSVNNGIQSPLTFVRGKDIFSSFPSEDRVKSKECEFPESKCNMFQGGLLNLELGEWLEEGACGVSGMESCPLSGNCKLTHESDVNLSLGSGLSSGCNGDSNKPNLYSRRTQDMVDLNKPIQVEGESVSAYVDNLDDAICLDEETWRRFESPNSKSGFYILSKESSQSSVGGRDERIYLNHMHPENDGNLTELPTYKNQAGQSKCNTDSLSGSVSLENSCVPFKSLNVEPGKVDEPSSFFPYDKSNQELGRKRKIFGVELFGGNRDQSVEASHAPNQWPLNPQFDVAKSESSSLLPRAQDVLSVRENSCISTCFPLNRSSSSLNGTEMEEGPSQCLVWDSTSPISASDAQLEKIEADASLSNSKILGFPIFVHQTSGDVTSLSTPSKSSCLDSDGDGGNDRKDLDHNPRSGGQLEAKDLVTEKGLGNYISGLRHHIDLNLCMNEDDVPPLPSLPRAVLKIATTEIDLEAPAVLESDSEVCPTPEVDSLENQLSSPSELPLEESKEHNEKLVRVAAEAIIAISSSDLKEDITYHPLCVLSCDSLHWFAEIVSSYDGDLEGEFEAVFRGTEGTYDTDSIPDGMDDFEFMTLRLTETKVEEHYIKPPALQNQRDDETAAAEFSKRPRRGQARRGRQRKDFQRDVLPGLVTLARHEVTADLQAIEELFKATGIAWQPSQSQRNTAKNGRGRRRVVDSALSPATKAVPLPPVEQSIRRELVHEEGTLTGWGKRTRRLPRHRCPTDNPTRVLKCPVSIRGRVSQGF